MVPRQNTKWFPCGYHVHTMWVSRWSPQCVKSGHHMISIWKSHCFYVDKTWFSIWLVFHHFYIISVANRSQKIANLWKPVTSLIMVWFSICKKFWKARGVLYKLLVSISQISWDFGMKQDVRESSWCLWCLWHHKLSCTSCLMPKSCEIWLIDTTDW